MSTGRVLWIIWCLLWAAGWFFLGLVTVVGVLVFWPLAFFSVLAILLPVGRPPAAPRAACPVCGVAGEPVLLPMHMQAAHGFGLPGYAAAPGLAQLGPGGQVVPQVQQVPQPPVVIEQQGYGDGPPVRPAYGPAPGATRPFPLPPQPPAG